MPIHELFVSDVTRDIPPVVYFHEQSPGKLAAEVSEYIITGGWPPEHPNHRRVPDGIHEQYVRLLKAILAELESGGSGLPNIWISGFYGSGKSIFAKLLGLALDGVALPDSSSLAQAWLQRDTSPRAAELRAAWQALRQKIDPLAVVFDVGGYARSNEDIHAAAVRQVQKRLDYCSTEPLVADFELKLERDGEWARFTQTAADVLERPWTEVKDKALAEEQFSRVMAVMFPGLYSDPMSWYTSRAGIENRSASPEEAVAAIGDMLRYRRPDTTLFIVIDEVSQYIHAKRERVDRLRAFATALGARLKGRAWLLALGQQKLDEEADDSFLVWAKDRFPPKLRVHLAATNIRDVVHKRLLQKKPMAETKLRSLFDANRPDLKLYAYGCEAITPDDFVEVYPMLPGHIDLLLQITSALRMHSARAQGDDQAIRGLLQLLGELFRGQKLAELPVGTLVTLDQIYEVQHTALDSDVQNSMARVLDQCRDDASGLLVRAAKAVALLELIQESVPTDAKLVAQCLYDRVDRGNQVPAITEALEELRRRNLLGYSQKQGYKLQSSAGEEWERERREFGVARETLSQTFQDALKNLLETPERPRLQSRAFPWTGVFSDGRVNDDVNLLDSRDHAVVRVDFRLLSLEERTQSIWVQRSAERALANRLVWVAGDPTRAEDLARQLVRSERMIGKYKPRRESLNPARRSLLQQEENRAEDLAKDVRNAVAETWMAGTLYLRGQTIRPPDHGASFAIALHSAATAVLPELYPHFIETQVQPAELLQLIATDLTGPSPKFLGDGLGVLELDGGRYVPACSGVVPRRTQEYIEAQDGLSGNPLLAYFGGPPYGYADSVVKACVAGLLRAGRLRVQPESGQEITAVRDAGVHDLFEKDRAFRHATFFPAGTDDVGAQSRARICRFFKDQLGHEMDREDHAIADAVAQHFPLLAQNLRTVLDQLNRLPNAPETPGELRRLQDALEQCVRTCRQTKPTVKLVKKHLDELRDGVQLLKVYEAELTDEAVAAVRAAAEVRAHQLAQLRGGPGLPAAVAPAAARLDKQLQSERPWRDISAVDADLVLLRQTYAEERGRLLGWQEQQVEQARSHVKGRDGFSTLTADQSHHVLRPLADAMTDTTQEAVAPALDALQDPFVLKLQRAEARANELLDEILSEDDDQMVVPVDLTLRNREVASEEDVEALVEEIRERLLAQVRSGKRVRLL